MPTSKGQIRQTLHCGSLSVPTKAHKGYIWGGQGRDSDSYSRDLGNACAGGAPSTARLGGSWL